MQNPPFNEEKAFSDRVSEWGNTQSARAPASLAKAPCWALSNRLLFHSPTLCWSYLFYLYAYIFKLNRWEKFFRCFVAFLFRIFIYFVLYQRVGNKCLKMKCHSTGFSEIKPTLFLFNSLSSLSSQSLSFAFEFFVCLTISTICKMLTFSSYFSPWCR